ncbi:MAG: 30S ribosome-binding factor RbfA, partial [Clostridiales bacterium]|nr:30S ribosome-binding factor RbfA [Clostridiales bacterium]
MQKLLTADGKVRIHMPGFHIDRISEDIKRELIAIIRTLKDPRIGEMLAVIKVDVSSDLSYAKVYVSSIEGIESAKTSVKGLESAQGYIATSSAQAFICVNVPSLH